MEDLRDQLIEGLLREELGGDRPPDVTARVLARAFPPRGKRARLMVGLSGLAALILVGLGVSWKLSVSHTVRPSRPSEADEFSVEDDAPFEGKPLRMELGAIGDVPYEMPAYFTELGGNAQSEAAVQMGLRWLADHQGPEGNWSVLNFARHATCQCGNAAQLKDTSQYDNDIAGTALALLPFLARGETHKGSEEIHSYAKVVERGMNYLLSRQMPGGDFEDASPGTLYPQAMATLALCELYGMTRDPRLESYCQRAIDCIVKAQHAGGGWRYQPQVQPGDLSVTSWQAQALKSAQLAGLTIPPETTQRLRKFLKQTANSGGDGYSYQKNRPVNATMTACGLLINQYLDSGNPVALPPKATDRLLAEPPTLEGFHMYYYYYATQVLFNLRGEPWKSWNPKMRDLLIVTQDKGTKPGLAHQKGSWAPGKDKWDNRGGRLMVTSLALLTLEVYYRHTPLNGELGQWVKDSDKKVLAERRKKLK